MAPPPNQINDSRVAELARQGMTNAAIARELGCHEKSVRRARERLGLAPSTNPGGTREHEAQKPAESEMHRPDGTSDYVLAADRAWGFDDFREFIRSKGQNPDEVSFSWGVTTNPSGGYWNKLQNVRPKTDPTVVDVAAIEARVRAYRPAVTLKADPRPQSLVTVPTDIQLGKVDWNGGSDQTVEQVLDSFSRVAEMAVRERPQEIVIVDAGDIIENIYSTSSQLATNDLDLPHQVEAAMHVMLTGIQMLAPLAPSLKYVAVSSNHGAHRVGQKAPGGDVHADYGLVVAKMLGHALRLNAAVFGHVEVITPRPFMESLAFETSGSRIGVVHGHQAGSADKLGEWWKGQSHGRMPTADARILIAGHWHSLRVQQSGDARWILVGPASDRGSSWFTNARGESSQTGMLTFLTRDNAWEQLQIL